MLVKFFFMYKSCNKIFLQKNTLYKLKKSLRNIFFSNAIGFYAFFLMNKLFL